MAGYKNINPSGGNSFSKDNQPTPEAKSKGKKKKRDLADLANALVNGERLEKCKAIAKQVGIDLENNEYTLQVAMTLTQIAKAIDEGDTRAFNAAMDRLLGKPTLTTKEIGVSKVQIDLNEIIK